MLPREGWGVLLGIAVLYFLLARLGLSLAFATRQVTALWPPTGLAVAAALLRGPRVWPGIWLGAFAANAFAQEPMLVAAGVATGNTLAPLFASHLLRRFGGFDPAFQRLKDVFSLVFLGAIVPMILSASAGVLSLVLGGIVPLALVRPVWWVWWAGDTLGVLLVTPLILTWWNEPRLGWKGWQVLEAVLLTGSLLVVAKVVLSGTPAHHLQYLVFPLIIWASLRFGPREIATLIGAVSGLAIWEAVHGRGPFAVGSQDERIIFLEVFMSVVVVTAFTLAASAAERRSALETLKRAHGELEARVEERTQALSETNQQLRESEARYQALFDLLPDGISLVRLSDGTLSGVNGAWEEMFGFSRQEALGRTTEELGVYVKPEDRMALFGRLPESGRIPMFQLDLARKDGTPLVAELNGRVMNVQGEPSLLCVIRDTSEKHALAMALQESEARFRTVAEESPVALFLHREGRFLYANPAGLRLLGAQGPFDLLGTPILERVHPGDREKVKARIRRAMESLEEAPRIQERFLRLDGTSVDVEAVGRTVMYEGELTMVLFAEDITDRKRAETALRLSEQRFRSLFFDAPIGHALNRLEDGWFLMVNDAFAGMTGYTLEELNRLSYWDLTPREFAEQEAAQLDSLRTQGKYGPYEKEYLRKDGSRIPVLLNGTSIQDMDGTQLILSVVADITERKQEEATREALIQELQKALHQVQSLGGLLPICSWCKKIRDDQGYWNQVEAYISQHSEAKFTHGVCPDCARKFREL